MFYCFLLAVASPSSEDPDQDEVEDSEQAGITTLTKAVALSNSSSSDLQAIVSCLREMNTTTSSRLSAIAVGVEKVASAVNKVLAVLESKERDEARAKLKNAVDTASNSADLHATMVCKINKYSLVSQLRILLFFLFNF